ncbi:DNA polymerase III subunit alpha (plasmid) [Pseudomonas sp. Leaf58]|uniref:DNA polymerase III subunit alpha n=1 Tax=Pseudomonas sp. Leaf58 TaxID=1736226 RepID=UPI0006FC35DC|nr:DNA polymerase III subunit alpha [Pseudomonas sp. Leaf58]AYG47637.1 DNA polymerase III subunit alpha [Pseudomonas sp. Leaf58]KQN62801.1 DNA polymerase III subunit alpha [Pseudomonas sp. Leaf58]
MSFVHLSVHSEYALHDSLVRVKPLMARVKELGQPAIAITDPSNLFATVKAYLLSMEKGVKPIVAAEIKVSTPRYPSSTLSLYCRNGEGYRALCEIISRGYTEAPRDKDNHPVIPLEWLDGKTDHLIALSGGREGEVGRLLMSQRMPAVKEALADYQLLFQNNFFIELQRIGHVADDRYVREAVNLAIEHALPVVATNPTRFLDTADFGTHEVRLAIAQGRTVRALRDDLNAPCTPHQYLKSSEDMIELFSDIPEAITNTLKIAGMCNVDLTLGKSFLPAFPAPNKMTEADYLRKSSIEGLEVRLRYNFKTPEAIAEKRQTYEDRLNFELKVINDMGFPGYFLIVADFIRWAKENDIPVGPGRGSGAGSLVAYALGITDLDPLPYDLLFERFLNPERVSMPDFDVDFCMDKRDQVIKYVSNAYGHDSVSQIVTFGSMAAKMVVRDVARALGYPYRVGNTLANLIPKEPDITLEKALARDMTLKVLLETDQESQNVWFHATKLEGVTRQTGKHAGGVVIAPTKLSDYTPVLCEPDGSGLVSQYDKDDVEKVGMVKFDFLGLRNLTIIDHAMKSINARRRQEGVDALDINAIDLADKATYEMIQRCETTAVFQLESSGMKNLIKRLQPDCFEDLIALVALFRPGPLQSGMVDDFIDRKHGRAELSYPHPNYQYQGLKPVLEPTYGIILYQEQVMQIAQVMAGYTLGGADMLRRAMGKKKPEEMAKQRGGFIEGSVKNGISEYLAGNIFDLVEKFAGYGFNKSHSAAYALIAYQTAYLKTHYPAEFMAAVLSSDMDNTDKVVRFLHESKKMGLTIRTPDINKSEWSFTTHDGEIVYGMGAIKGFGDSAAKTILDDRKKNGPFHNLIDFNQRNKVGSAAVNACIHAGMFDYTDIARQELLEIAPLAMAAGKQVRKNTNQGMLFDMEIPVMPRAEFIPVDDEVRLAGERKVLGLYLTGHPYDRYRESLKNSLTAQLIEIAESAEQDTVENPQARNKYKHVSVAGLISDIDPRSNSKGTYAFFKLDDGTAQLDCMIFNKPYHEYQAFMTPDNLVVMHGVVRINPKTNGASLIIDRVQPLESFVDTQPGTIIVEQTSIASVLGLMSAHDSNGEEGNLQVAVRNAEGDLIDVPALPISRKSKTLAMIQKRFGDKVSISYSKSMGRAMPRKDAVDIEAETEIEDLSSHLSELREKLERSLSAAKAAMTDSMEMS